MKKMSLETIAKRKYRRSKLGKLNFISFNTLYSGKKFARAVITQSVFNRYRIVGEKLEINKIGNNTVEITVKNKQASLAHTIGLDCSILSVSRELKQKLSSLRKK